MSTVSARLYETDFYGWIQQQAGVLKAGSFASLDLDNLIEEIESMGKSHQRALESRLEILLIHLLKWQYQPTRRTPGWAHTIREQRRRIAGHLKKNPSLAPRIPEVFDEAYDYAVPAASAETGMKETVFPKQCPWSFEQTMDEDFWPQADTLAKEREPVFLNG